MAYSRITYRFWEHEDWHDDNSPLVAVYCNIVDGCDPTIAVSEFEFCTGLKDKHGALIYEGDLVKNPEGHVYEIVWDDEMVTYEGREQGWRNNKYDITMIEPFYKDAAKELEIVGNIHKGVKNDDR